MKPKKLVISGLNSFVEKQEIDFEKLTERGTFGIFGPTGSGKSTILDAITIALYGSIARDTNEFINSSVDSTFISYEFEIGLGGERKTYIVDRIIKRNKKGGYKTTTARLRRILGESEDVISEGSDNVKSSIEEIIGLTSADFTRSVVLPQGKFSEFLKLTGRERRNMLERIFGLEKYGRVLGEKIRKAKWENQNNINVLTGNLEYYKDISKETFKSKQEQYNTYVLEGKQLKSDLKKLQEDYDKYKDIWKLQEELCEFEDKFKELEDKKDIVHIKENNLFKGKSALKVKPFMDIAKETENKLTNSESEFIALNLAMTTLNEKLEITEEKYNSVCEQKEKEIPELIKKQTNLNQAIEILKAADIIEIQRQELLEKYNKKHFDYKKLCLEFDNINKDKEILVRNIKDFEKTHSEVKIDSSYREEVQRAFSLEEEYKGAFELCKSTNLKVSSKVKNIKIIEEKYSILKNQIEDNNCKIKDINKVREEHINKCPGDNDMLLDLQKKLNEITERYKKVVEENSKLIEYNKSLEKFKENKSKIENKLQKLREEKEKLREKLKVTAASSLALELQEGDPCPVCGSVHHPLLAKSEVSVSVEENRQLDTIEDKEKELELDLVRLNSEVDYISREINNINNKCDVESLETLSENKISVEKQFIQLKKDLESFNTIKHQLDEKYEILKEEKSTYEKQETGLLAELNGEKQVTAELKKDGIQFDKRSSELKTIYEEIVKKLGLSSIKEEIKKIKSYDEEGEKLQKQIKECRDKLDKLEVKDEEIKSKIQIYEIDIAKITESGKEKRSFVDSKKEEAQVLSEGKDADQYIKIVKSSIDTIMEQYKTLTVELQDIKKEKDILSEKIFTLKQNRINLKESFESQKETVNKCLKENEFNSIEEAIDSLLKEEELKELEDYIEDYKNKLKNVEINMERINKKLGSQHIEKEQWEDIDSRLKEKSIVIEENTKNTAMLYQEVENLEKALKELSKLKKQEIELTHRKSLLEDLDKLVQGNKFVEFVATNQMKYIAFEASKRLKDITRGRYALELNEEGNFTMRDDFNGGSVRPTNTLSGGETFLTSLCLALALSSQIQLKGSAPLELFFLDEGFGSLDSELLETVMSSLERLNSDKLCVGIISHVDELRNRVPVKLIVSPAEAGVRGSRVKVEYS